MKPSLSIYDLHRMLTFARANPAGDLLLFVNDKGETVRRSRIAMLKADIWDYWTSQLVGG